MLHEFTISIQQPDQRVVIRGQVLRRRKAKYKMIRSGGFDIARRPLEAAHIQIQPEEFTEEVRALDTLQARAIEVRWDGGQLVFMDARINVQEGALGYVQVAGMPPG